MEIQPIERIVAEHPFFAELEADHTNLLAGCASNVRFPAGAYILREGQEANEFFLVREGQVAIEIAAPHRKPIIVDTVGEGEILGWSWLLPPYLWRFDARAVAPTRAIALDGKCLRAKCESNHDLGFEVLKRFSQIMNRRLDATRIQLLDVYGAR
jgi:CRP/FNR family transcriptional regulator, cyclic AMP receptor protein